MTNRKLLTSAALAAVAYIMAGQAGYQGDAKVVIPGTGIDGIQADVMRIIFSAIAAFLPAMADKWLPGLGKIVKQILDSLLDSQASKDPESAKLADSAAAIDAIDDLIGGTPEGRVVIEKLICQIYKCKHAEDKHVA